MKKNVSVFYGLLFVCIVILMFLFNQCKKEEVHLQYYRINEMKNFENESLVSINNYFYEGDKINLILGKNYDEWGDSVKTEIEYPDENTIVQVDYIKESYDNSWDTPVTKRESKSEGGQIVQYTTFDYRGMEWISTSRIEYKYSNGELIQEIGFSYYDLTDTSYSLVYVYNANLLVNAVEYYFDVNGIVTYKLMWEIGYNDDELNEIGLFQEDQGSWIQYGKYLYKYQNDLIIGMDVYDEGYDIPVESYFFSYDSQENLTSWLLERNGGISTKIEYAYDEGKGNFNHMQPPNIVLNFPIPTKSAQSILNETR